MSRSNTFKTKDNDLVKRMFKKIGFDESFSTDEQGVVVAGYDATELDEFEIIYLPDGTIDAYDTEYNDYDYNDEYDDYKRISFIDWLQDMIDDDAEIIIKHIGYEGLRYLDAWAEYISKTKYRVIDFSSLLNHAIENIRLQSDED
jgi:hypothetical protein